MFWTAVTAGFTVQREVWHRPQSSDWCVHDVFGTFHDKRWPADLIMCCRTFVRLCGTRLLSEDTPFMHPVSMRWCKRHSDIRFKRAERPDWRHICTYRIWIAFQTTSLCALDLICENCISFGCFLLSRLLETNPDTAWMWQKSNLGWQA